MNEADGLKAAAGALETGSGLLPGVAGTAARVAAIALNAAAEFAEAGMDPEDEIRRILSSISEVEEVHDGWQDAIERKFPKSETPEGDGHASER